MSTGMPVWYQTGQFRAELEVSNTNAAVELLTSMAPRTRWCIVLRDFRVDAAASHAILHGCTRK